MLAVVRLLLQGADDILLQIIDCDNIFTVFCPSGQAINDLFCEKSVLNQGTFVAVLTAFAAGEYDGTASSCEVIVNVAVFIEQIGAQILFSFDDSFQPLPAVDQSGFNAFVCAKIKSHLCRVAVNLAGFAGVH